MLIFQPALNAKRAHFTVLAWRRSGIEMGKWWVVMGLKNDRGNRIELLRDFRWDFLCPHFFGNQEIFAFTQINASLSQQLRQQGLTCWLGF